MDTSRAVVAVLENAPQFLIVVRRWAIEITEPFISFSIVSSASCTSFSARADNREKVQGSHKPFRKIMSNS